MFGAGGEFFKIPWEFLLVFFMLHSDYKVAEKKDRREKEGGRDF